MLGVCFIVCLLGTGHVSSNNPAFRKTVPQEMSAKTSEGNLWM